METEFNYNKLFPERAFRVRSVIKHGQFIAEMLKTFIIFDPKADDVCVTSTDPSIKTDSAFLIISEIAEFLKIANKEKLYKAMVEKIHVPVRKPEDEVYPSLIQMNTEREIPVLAFALSASSKRSAIYWNDTWYLYDTDTEHAILDFNPKVGSESKGFVEKISENMDVLKWLYWLS